MTTASPIPRRVKTPRWLDVRLVLGVVLVLASVLIGAKVVSSADTTSPMWAASRDLGPGVVLAASDLKPVRVRLPQSGGAYVPVTETLVGKTLKQRIGAGELLARSSIGRTEPATTVTIPLNVAETPKLSRGDHIEVWVSTKTCRAVTVVRDVAVQDVRTGGSGFSSAGTEGVVVRMIPDLAERIISALDMDGAVIRAGILSGSDVATALPDLGRCAASS